MITTGLGPTARQFGQVFGQQVLADVESLHPTCVVIDSLSELRLLSGSALRYRRQLLALKQYFNKRGCTVMLLDDLTAMDQNTHVQSIVHGMVTLQTVPLKFGINRRFLTIPSLH